MNILLTNYCNAGCVYCFAANTMQAARKSDNTGDKIMSLENLSIILDYIKTTTPHDSIRLLGGEPTLYPNLEKAIQMILNKGFNRIEIFSNGFIQRPRADILKKYLDHICFVWNINPAGMSNPFLEKMIDHTLHELSTSNNAIGFNIYKTDYNPSFIFNYLKKHPGLSHVRIGIAHPMGSSEITQKQSVIRIGDYPKVGSIIYEFARRIKTFYPQVKSINLDCGYAPCLFTPAQFKFMTTQVTFHIHEPCSPALTDLSTNLLVNPCFATSAGNEKYKLTDFKNLRQAIEYNKARWYFTRKYLPKINYDCKQCQKSKTCFLGCGGERILEAKKQRTKLFQDVDNEKIKGIRKAKLLLKIAQSFGSTYEQEKALVYLTLVRKEIRRSKDESNGFFKKFLKKVSSYEHELKTVYTIDSYTSIDPDIDLYNYRYQQLLRIKNSYIECPTQKLLKEYTALISNIIFKTNLSPQVHLDHYQRELRNIGKQKSEELKEYIRITNKEKYTLKDQYFVYTYANLLKKSSGVQKATQYLRMNHI